MRCAVVASLGLSLWLAVACGGRSIEEDGLGGDDSITAVGGQGGGGRGSGGFSVGARSSGGSRAAGGTFSSAGSTSAGGVPGVAAAPSVGGGCACPAIACGPGARPVPNPDGCCFHCESSCQNIPCAGVACEPGSRLEQLPGQCCPSCVVDECSRERMSYRNFRAQLFEKYSSLGCRSAKDCGVYYEKNQCEVGCGVAMPRAAVSDLERSLQSFAQSTCSPQCPIDLQACEAVEPPSCVRGRCQF